MKLIRTFACLSLLIVSTSNWAMMPPKYLSVANWQSCAQTQTKGSAQFVCLPGKKPINCSRQSWKQLTRQHLIPYCHR